MDGRQMTVRPRAMALTMLAVGGLALFSCSGPVVTAVGDSSDLVIVVDDGASELSELVEGVMGETVTWLVKEPCFRTTVTTPEQLGDLRNMRHVLLVGSWDGGSVEGLPAPGPTRTGHAPHRRGHMGERPGRRRGHGQRRGGGRGLLPSGAG